MRYVALCFFVFYWVFLLILIVLILILCVPYVLFLFVCVVLLIVTLFLFPPVIIRIDVICGSLGCMAVQRSFKLGIEYQGVDCRCEKC